MVGDLAGKSTGLVKQDLHGWEAVGRTEYDSIYVKIGVDQPQKLTEGCLAGLFPRDYWKQTNSLRWQEWWSLCDLQWRFWGFGQVWWEQVGTKGQDFPLGSGFSGLPQARRVLAFFHN